ncbi:RHS domain-containing protein [Pantoea ananatis]|nr:RHS domain-containing protein [Pantoea ananatis]
MLWFNTDLNGTPLEITDELGDIRWSCQYGSFGEVRRQTKGFTRLAKQSALPHQPCAMRASMRTAKPVCTTICSVITIPRWDGLRFRTR